MRYLVVYAHPLEDSYHAALHRAVVRELVNAGHAVDDLDLYRTNFQPVLSGDEARAYQALGINTMLISEHVERLGLAGGIIFIFPTWYYGMPAILKGYFDRVWVPGVAFDMVDGRTRPLLTHIRRFCVITCYGSPFFLNKFYLGDPNKRVFMRGLRHLMPNAKTLWLALYSMDSANERKRVAFIRKLERKIARL